MTTVQITRLVAAALLVAGSGCGGKVSVFGEPGTGGTAAGGSGTGGSGTGGSGTGGGATGGSGAGGNGVAGAAGCGDTTSDIDVYYPFDICSDTSPEALGTGLDATLHRGSCNASDSLSTSLGASWSSGTALFCDGQGLCAEAPDDLRFEPARFTLSAWIYSDDFGLCGAGMDQTCSILSKANTDSAANGYWLTLLWDTPRLTLSGGGMETNIWGPSMLSTSTWHHMAATFDGATGALYVDGVLEASEPINHSVDYGSESFLIGSMTNRNFDFYGNIEEVTLRDYAMTAAEVAELYDAYFDCP